MANNNNNSKIQNNRSIKTQDQLGADAAAAAGTGEMVEVLYQKMGDRWFAFSLIDDEVFVGSITQDEIDAVESSKDMTRKIAGNS